MRYNYPNIVTLNLIIWCENIHMFIYLCYKGLCPIWSVCSRYLTQLMTNNRIRTVGCFNWIMSLEAWSPVTGSSLWASVAFCKSDQAESNSCTQTQLDYFIYVYSYIYIYIPPDPDWTSCKFLNFKLLYKNHWFGGYQLGSTYKWSSCWFKTVCLFFDLMFEKKKLPWEQSIC